MARVTVEDCVEKVSSRFELVMLAAQRSRDISAGSEISVECDNDKNPVVALREIAEETVDPSELEQTVVKGLQKHIEIDEPEEEEMDLLAIQQEISGAMEEDAKQEGLPEDVTEGEAADAADTDAAAADDAEDAPTADETPQETDTDDVKDGEG